MMKMENGYLVEMFGIFRKEKIKIKLENNIMKK